MNPTGSFIHGGPSADAGVTGRKIIVDSYGGWGRHGGGAFSGKDPSKVDRSSAYFCRYVAKQVVASGFAKKAEIQVGYAIGMAKPVSVKVDTFGTGDERAAAEFVMNAFDFRPRAIIDKLDLLRPIYRQSTNYGHFGRPGLPWEAVEKAAAVAEVSRQPAQWIDEPPRLTSVHSSERARTSAASRVADVRLTDATGREVRVRSGDSDRQAASRMSFCSAST